MLLPCSAAAAAAAAAVAAAVAAAMHPQLFSASISSACRWRPRATRTRTMVKRSADDAGDGQLEKDAKKILKQLANAEAADKRAEKEKKKKET